MVEGKRYKQSVFQTGTPARTTVSKAAPSSVYSYDITVELHIYVPVRRHRSMKTTRYSVSYSSAGTSAGYSYYAAAVVLYGTPSTGTW